MNDKAWTFEEIVRGVWEKRPEAQFHFVEHFRGPLYDFIQLYQHDAHVAEDALLETFFAAFRTPICPDWSRERYVNYLFRIARNQAVNTVRQRIRHEEIGDFSTVELVATTRNDPAASVCAQDAVLHALERLTEANREVIYLSNIGGWSDEAIAALLGVAIGTVRSRKSRGLAEFRRYLAENE